MNTPFPSQGEAVHRLGIAMTPGVNASVFDAWMQTGATVREFFSLSMHEICEAIGMNVKLPELARQEALARARAEMEFAKRHNIRIWLSGDADYPYRVHESPDAPAVLFAAGNGHIDSAYNISVVGTRKPTPYGLRLCHELIAGVAAEVNGLTVISGLAYGVDARAHRSALDLGLSTVAVVAHGLDMVYPAMHRNLAREIASRGGLLVTEYPSGERPYKRRFLERNRIVAAMADATLVIESGVRGGALSTANVAFDLDRTVFAVPGRAGDEMSEGCNLLIRRQKGVLATSPAHILDTMMWKSHTHESQKAPVQKQIFSELAEEHMPVYAVLKESGEVLTFDIIHSRCGLSVQQTMSALTEMEFDGVIVRYPGNRFALD